jgi:hypothetical protein
MKIVSLSLVAMLVLAGTSRAQEGTPTGIDRPAQTGQTPEMCSTEFWRRAVTVATGHGHNFEVAARQIGRERCDCVFVSGKPKACNASVVPEAEAVPVESNE